MTDPHASRVHVRLPFLPALEGLRGIGVLVILLFHAEFAWMKGGFLGVSTFFTLSGFLITNLLVVEHERDQRIDLRAFYARRLRRILPAALLALAGITVFGAFAAEVSQQMRLRGDGLSGLFYVANWWLMATGAEYASQLGAPSPVQHFWSLAIEEQFYLFHPWLVMIGLGTLGGSRRRLVVLLGVLTLASWLWGAWLESSLASNSRLYYGTDTRCAELFAGALLALLFDVRAEAPSGRKRTAVSLGGVAGFALSAVFWVRAAPDDVFLYRGGLAIYAACSVAIVAASTLPTGPVRALLSTAPLRWLGRVSYGAYLYHWPLFLWLDAERTELGPWALAALRVGVTLLVAELSHRFLEEPIRSRRRLHSWRLWAAPIAAVAGIVAGLFAATAGLSDPWPKLAFGRSSVQEQRSEDRVRILVLGDSVADGIGQGLVRWGQESGLAAVVPGANPGCGVARGARVGERAAAQARACDHWQNRWGSKIKRSRPDVVVMLSTGWDLIPRRLPGWKEPRVIGDPEFDAWLLSEFELATQLLSSRGARVAWLTSPCVKPRGEGAVGVFDPERTRNLNHGILAPLAASRPVAVSLIDLFGAVCPDGEFTNQLDGVDDLRPDGIHFSDAGADWLARWLGPQLVALAPRRTKQ